MNLIRELIRVWSHTRSIILIALMSAIYAAVLIPLKAIPIIPGLTELRPANVLPVVFSLLFGPAAAWGSAIGNTIGDIFGGIFGVGSIFGFIGNFFFGLVPYLLWGKLGFLSSGKKPVLSPKEGNYGRQLLEYFFVALFASASCAVIIAWGVDLFALAPFSAIVHIILLNNFFAAAILGPLLLPLFYRRVERWGLLADDLMDREETVHSRTFRLGTALLFIGVIGAYTIGNLIAFGWLSAGVGIPAGSGIFIVLLIISLLLF